MTEPEQTELEQSEGRPVRDYSGARCPACATSLSVVRLSDGRYCFRCQHCDWHKDEY